MRLTLITAGLLVVPAAPAAAQLGRPMPDTAIHVLQVPTADRMVCHPPATGSDSAPTKGVTIWEFLIGTPRSGPMSLPPRNVKVAFDRAGHPLVLVDAASVFPVRTEQVTVRFTGTEAVGLRSDARFDSTAMARVDSVLRHGSAEDFRKAVANAVPRSAPRAMTAKEYEQARALSAWLWEHRCRRG